MTGSLGVPERLPRPRREAVISSPWQPICPLPANPLCHKAAHPSSCQRLQSTSRSPVILSRRLSPAQGGCDHSELVRWLQGCWSAGPGEAGLVVGQEPQERPRGLLREGVPCSVCLAHPRPFLFLCPALSSSLNLPLSLWLILPHCLSHPLSLSFFLCLNLFYSLKKDG